MEKSWFPYYYYFKAGNPNPIYYYLRGHENRLQPTNLTMKESICEPYEGPLIKEIGRRRNLIIIRFHFQRLAKLRR